MRCCLPRWRGCASDHVQPNLVPLATTISDDACSNSPEFGHANSSTETQKEIAAGDVRAAKSAAARLLHEDPAERQAAVEELGRLRAAAEPYAPQLVHAAVADNFFGVRVAALEVLGRLRRSVAATHCAALMPCLCDNEWLVRSAAALTLGDLSDVTALEDGCCKAIAKLLQDPHEDVRGASQRALAALGGSTVPHVLPFLDATSADARQAAAELLGRLTATTIEMADHSAECVASRLKDDASSVRGAAAVSLRHMNHSGAAAAARHLRDAEDDVRLRAVEVLGDLGKAAVPHTAELIRLLEDSDADVRQAAAAVLAELGWDDVKIDKCTEVMPKTASDLVSCLDDANSAVRHAALKELWEGRFTEASSYLESLAQRLGDSDARVRAMAAQLLGQIAPAGAKEYATVLANRLAADKDADVRCAAAQALGALEREVTELHVGVLANRLTDLDWHVRVAVVTVLGRFSGPAVLPLISGIVRRLVSDPQPKVRLAAAVSLGELGPEIAANAADDLAASACKDISEEVRAAAAHALQIVLNLAPDEDDDLTISDDGAEIGDDLLPM